MDVIGQHLDGLDAHWLTFGNDYLEQWEILSARMTRKFVKRSKFFSLLITTFKHLFLFMVSDDFSVFSGQIIYGRDGLMDYFYI